MLHFRAVLVLAAGVTASLQAQTPVHPRLFFGPEDIPEIRARILEAPYAAMYAKILADKDTDDSGLYPFGNGLQFDEADPAVPEGGTKSLGIRLTQAPTGNVTITASFRVDADADLSIVGNTSLTFTPANYNTWQFLSFAAAENAAEDLDTADGNGSLALNSGNYAQETSITVTEIDNDTDFILSRLRTAIPEGGNTSLTVRLRQAPVANLTVSCSRPSNADADINVVTGSSLVFSTGNWNVPQTVILSAAQDTNAYGDSAPINFSASGLSNRTITAYEVDDEAFPAGYDYQVRGLRYAFLYVLTGNDTYAQEARNCASLLVNSGEWGSTSVKGLTNYAAGTRVAWMYDWCYSAPSWDAAFRTLVSTKLRVQGDMIAVSGGSEQNNSAASNWQGNRGAAALHCYLATDDFFSQANFESAYARTTNYLRSNLGTNATDNHGWNIESIGYTIYPMGSFVGPAGIALFRYDPIRDLRAVCAGSPWQLYTVYASIVRYTGFTQPLHPDFSDDNPGARGEGNYALAFWWCPPALQGALKYWYDRTTGGLGYGDYETRNAASFWPILLHPGNSVGDEDPMSVPEWREGFGDTGGVGMFTWRDAYAGPDDIIAQMYMKLRGNSGHAGPDGLGFRIFGLDTPFAVGGGRYGLKTGNEDVYKRNQNSLYAVDPDTFELNDSGNASIVVGAPFFRADGSGHVVGAMPAGRLSNLGVSDWKRRFVAAYGTASGADATFVVSDTSTDGGFWQICTLETNTITTNGSSFTITGPSGNSLRGTVLHPVNATFTTGDRIRGTQFDGYDNNKFVHFQSADGDYLVVMTLTKNGTAHPAVSANGTWSGTTPAGQVQVGNFTVDINGDSISYPAPGNQPPVANFTVTPGPGTTNFTVTANASGSSDPDGSIVTYAWDFNNDGGTDATGPTAVWTYTGNASSGTWPVRLTVVDDDGASATQTSNGIAVNVSPIARFTVASPSGGGGFTNTTFTFNGATSADYELITANLTSANLTYQWDFNSDGVYDQVSTPGTTNGTWTYSSPGQYVVTLRVVDAGGASNITITNGTVGVYANATGTPRLIHHYRFDDNPEWGATVKDVSGFGPQSNGTMEGMQSGDGWSFQSPAATGWSANFTTSEDRMSFRPTKFNDLVGGSSNATTVVWQMKLTALSNSTAGGSDSDRLFVMLTSGSNGFCVGYNGSATASPSAFRLGIGVNTNTPNGSNSTTSNVTTSTLNATDWITVAVTYSSATDRAKVYAGTSHAALAEIADLTITTSNISDSGGNLTLNRANARSAQGYFDNLRIYDGELTLAQLQAITETPAGYPWWISSQPWIPPGLRFTGSDGDRDGLNNLAEYFFGTDPALVSAPPQGFEWIDPTTLRLTYTRRKILSEVSSLVQWSTDLDNWNPPDAQHLVTNQVIPGNGTTDTINATITHPGTDSTFFGRLFIWQ
jgi:hypothetical protein